MLTVRLRVAATTDNSVTLVPDNEFPLQKGEGSITLSPITSPAWAYVEVGHVLEFDQVEVPWNLAPMNGGVQFNCS